MERAVFVQKTNKMSRNTGLGNFFGFWKKREVGVEYRRVGSGDYRENIVYAENAQSAMRITAVYRAVNLISSSCALLTLQYKRRNRAGNYFTLDNKGHGKVMNYLLGVQPNDRMNSYTMIKYMVAQILLQGNAFIYPVRNSFGDVASLILLTPGSVTYDVYHNTYTIGDLTNGINKTVPAKDILHFKNMAMDGGYWGKSTISYAAQTMNIAATADRETLKRFATGGRYKAFLQNNKSVVGFGEYQDKELENVADDMQDRLNTGRDVIAVPGDGTITPMSMSSADMQFLENRKFTIREIARAFNTPPSKLMDDSNANYKSVEVSNVAFFSEALSPIVTEIEREFSAKLLDVNTYQDYKFTFDLSKLYALDLESKGRHDMVRLQTGQATVNDIRRENDVAPVDKGEDVYISTNLALLGSPKMSGGTESPAQNTNNESEEKGGEE